MLTVSRICHIKPFVTSDLVWLSGHSCVTARIKVTDDTLTAVDKNELCIVVLLEYSMAFDRLNHELLISTFNNFVFNHLTHPFNKFPSDRWQFVLLENIHSDYRANGTGVPQDSVLSSLLFIMYYTCQLGKQLEPIKNISRKKCSQVRKLPDLMSPISI